MTYVHGGGNQIWRELVGPNDDGVDPNSIHNPLKNQIRDWTTSVEDSITALNSASLAGAKYTRDTLTELQAVSGAVADDVGLVLDDGANNGTYEYNGSTWTRVAGLPIVEPDPHTHDFDDIPGLQAALDGKATSAQGTKADTALQQANLDSHKSGIDQHPISGITGLQTALNAKASTTDLDTHKGAIDQHSIAGVTGLQAALDGKATTAQGAKADTALQQTDLDSHKSAVDQHSITGITGLQTVLDTKAATTEVNSLIDDYKAEVASKVGNVSAGIWVEDLNTYLRSATLDDDGYLVEGIYTDFEGETRYYKSVNGNLISSSWTSQVNSVYPGLWIPGFGYATSASLDATGYVVEATVNTDYGISKITAKKTGELEKDQDVVEVRGRIWLDNFGYATRINLTEEGLATQADVIDSNGNLNHLVVRGSSLESVSNHILPESPTDYYYARSPNNDFPATQWYVDDSTLYFILVWGQSYAQGTNPDTADTPVSGVTPYPDNLWMFGIEGESYGLLRPYLGTDTPLPVDRFVPLEERVSEETKETICSGLGETLYEAITANLPDANPKFLFATVGSGGARYEGLYRGSRFGGEEIPRLLLRAGTIAKSQGLKVCPILVVQHGEADNYDQPTELYAEMLKQLRRHVEEDARKILGIDDPLLCFVNQCNRGEVNSVGRAYRKVTTAPAALLAAAGDPHIFAASGLYATEPDAWPTNDNGGNHPSALGYRRAGEMLAQYVFAQLAHVGTPPLRIESAQRLTNTELVFRCNDLVMVDTSGDVVGTTGIAANGGIWVHDGSGTNLSITALENVDDETYASASSGTTRTLKATLSGTPLGYALEWFYGTNTTGDRVGRLEGARGLLRRPQDWGYTTDGTGDYNLVPFESRITTGDRRILSWCAVDQGIIH